MYNVGLLLNSLQDWFATPLGIVAMVVIAIGLAMVLLARNIARFIRKAKEVDNQDRIFITISILGVILMLVGLILAVVNCL
ncbi:MAG: hypothetical protein IJZ29_05390 [Clostridia bacterium]|nr:hypothetical protein [Clostridia bacterium]